MGIWVKPLSWIRLLLLPRAPTHLSERAEKPPPDAEGILRQEVGEDLSKSQGTCRGRGHHACQGSTLPLTQCPALQGV